MVSILGACRAVAGLCDRHWHILLRIAVRLLEARACTVTYIRQFIPRSLKASVDQSVTAPLGDATK